MAKSDKVSAVAEIADQFKGSTATVVTEYRGLSVGEDHRAASFPRRGRNSTPSPRTPW